MKVIIYGLGKSYSRFFCNHKFIEKTLIENGVEIIGFVDGSKDLWSNKLEYLGQEYEVKSIDSFLNSNVDKVIVTSKIYFYEIRDELTKKGYKKEQIILIDELYNEYLDQVFHVDIFEKRRGIEIGGPSKIFENIYKRCLACDNVCFSSYTVWYENTTGSFQYEDKVLGKMWIAEASNMYQIQSGGYDFLLSSNNLEHIANPIKALKEFTRLVKSGGLILVLVPMKEKNFDHSREYTTFEHIFEDYINDIDEDDLTHLPEIIERHDFEMDVVCGGKEKFIQRAKKNIENRCLHHHVFEENCLRKAFEFVNLEVVDFDLIEDNWMIIGKN